MAQCAPYKSLGWFWSRMPNIIEAKLKYQCKGKSPQKANSKTETNEYCQIWLKKRQRKYWLYMKLKKLSKKTRKIERETETKKADKKTKTEQTNPKRRMDCSCAVYPDGPRDEWKKGLERARFEDYHTAASSLTTQRYCLEGDGCVPKSSEKTGGEIFNFVQHAIFAG